MKRPARRKLIAFAKWSGFYWLIAFILVSLVSLRTCGMHPDIVASCSLTPINVAISLAFLSYFLLTLAYFRVELSGKH